MSIPASDEDAWLLQFERAAAEVAEEAEAKAKASRTSLC